VHRSLPRSIVLKGGGGDGVAGGPSWPVLGRSALRQLRLGSGLVLMAFATTHFLNHALGLVSFEAMQAGRRSLLGFWHGPPWYWLLGLAFIVHIAATLIGLLERRSLRMPPWQYLQIGLGLLIPVFLAVHYMGARALALAYGTETDYYWQLHIIWPGAATQQILALLLVWLHGCVGLHYWWRLRLWYRRLEKPLLALAVLLPTLAITGFIQGARAFKAEAEADPAWLAELRQAGGWPNEEQLALVYRGEAWIIGAFLGAVAAVLLGRLLRDLVLARPDTVAIAYDSGRRVRVRRGTSVLEASRMAGIAHASVCGGRGRCSTCRVRVEAAPDALPEPEPGEAKVLARLGAGPDIRLACQLRPTTDIGVTRLLPPEVGPTAAGGRMDPSQGTEREIAVLFADLRSFTRLAESRLPFDVVFILNRYFKAMGEAIEGEGGRIDKFMGDGIMALFGTEAPEPPAMVARRALAAARAMAEALAALNESLARELPAPLRMGIGLHLGPAIIGEMGHGRAVSLTAVGDTVNVASRLEAEAKTRAAELVVARGLVEKAGLTLEDSEAAEIPLRGRSAPLAVLILADARRLPQRHTDAPEPQRLPHLLRRGRRALGLSPESAGR